MWNVYVIVEREETLLRNQVIDQVKVQQKHLDEGGGLGIRVIFVKEYPGSCSYWDQVEQEPK